MTLHVRNPSHGRLARALTGAALLLPAAGCGGASEKPAAASSPDSTSDARPEAKVTASSAPLRSASGPGILAFDDGSPGRLDAVRAADGATTARLELDTTGATIASVSMSAANLVANVSGLEVPLTGSAGAWSGSVLLPMAGSWTFEVTVHRNDDGFVTDDLADVSVPL